MRSDHIPDHDRRLHMVRCFKCGEMYHMDEVHECFEDEDYMPPVEYDMGEPGRGKL